MKQKTYSIVDDNGNVYAHDIQSKYKAKCLIEEYKKKNPSATGIEII